PILFAATVGEEGSGDLRGVKYLLNGGRGKGEGEMVHTTPAPAAFIALDGAGMERIVHRALGSRRYHVTFRGPGGHSWAAFGRATPPLGIEIQLLGDRPSGVTPRTHPLVQAAIAANRILGKDAELASASTDANVPIALGVPAIALGAGGKAGDAHLTSEWYENT